MIVCNKCNAENDDNAAFCYSCGNRLKDTGSAETVVVDQLVRDELSELKDCLKGKYEITREIGRGGMAVVYEAVELSLDRSVALKVLPKEFTYDKQFVERFKQEIKTLAKIEHPNIVPLYAADEIGGFSFFTMKNIEGRTLAELIQDQKNLPVKQAVKVVRDVCKGLEFAHSMGIMHRDLKPENIMIDSKFGHVYVMDFGIAKALSSSRVTKEGTTVGTVFYMSPEQCTGGELDARSDLYSLGIILYEMLTGKIPFEGEMTGVMYKHVNTPPPPLKQIRPDLPRAVIDVVDLMLQKDRNKRPASARAVIDLLESLDLETGRGSKPKIKTPKSERAPLSGRTRTLLVSGGAVIVLLAAVTLFLFSSSRRLAGLYCQLGLWDRAIAGYSTVLKDNPKDSGAFKARGDCYREKKMYKDMLADYGRACALDPELAKSRFSVRVGDVTLVYIPGGSFTMGSDESKKSDEYPAHEVMISPFWMGKFEVTQKQFKDIMGFNPSFFTGETLPVEQVKWDDAVEFCRKLSAKFSVEARLPTEAEWEYACRAGSRSKFFWGGQGQEVCKYANILDKSRLEREKDKSLVVDCSDGHPEASPIGKFQSNAFGLHDMIGNVWEWCRDWYDSKYYKKSPGSDPQGAEKGKERVIRGASWRSPLGVLHSSSRNYGKADKGNAYLGFRIALAGIKGDVTENNPSPEKPKAPETPQKQGENQKPDKSDKKKTVSRRAKETFSGTGLHIDPQQAKQNAIANGRSRVQSASVSTEMRYKVLNSSPDKLIKDRSVTLYSPNMQAYKAIWYIY